ncbi:conserved exported hypothetical protein [Vibrio owensii]|uniref:hypothetical protein n=1 Tax=Vibrio owensii TaxID=696485 RepID=UPI00289516EF|nr:conserved exported hypothetical protein [Vibrio owensii]CAH1550556.1 conserved exported hypothetical protein [Vibrio owensii]
MFNSSKLRYGVLSIALVGMVSPTFAKPPAPKPPKHGKKVVVVKPVYRPVYKAPVHRVYHYNKIPRTATYLVIAGITYAVVDNVYYKRSGDQYIYVEQPPVSVQSEVNTASTTVAANKGMAGKVVDVLPNEATTVTVNGATFYVQGSDWYAPIAGTNQFVIVEPQL